MPIYINDIARALNTHHIEIEKFLLSNGKHVELYTGELTTQTCKAIFDLKSGSFSRFFDTLPRKHPCAEMSSFLHRPIFRLPAKDSKINISSIISKNKITPEEPRRTFTTVMDERFNQTRYAVIDDGVTEFTEDAARAIQRLSAFAFTSSESLHALGELLEALNRMLLKLASENVRGAAGLFLEKTKLSVAFLNALAAQQPDIFKASARFHKTWPCNRSLHPRFQDDFEKLCTSVELGKGIPIVVDKYSKWDPKDFGTRINIRLLTYINMLRKSIALIQAEEPYNPTIAKVAQLDAFSCDNSEQWWDVAWDFLVEAYPCNNSQNKIDIQPFEKMLSSSYRARSAGVKHAKIKEKLHDKFIHLASGK